jgi:hypothetical protein
MPYDLQVQDILEKDSFRDGKMVGEQIGRAQEFVELAWYSEVVLCDAPVSVC